MIRLLVISAFGGLGYFAIQYLGGWMIYLPAAQQLSIALYAITICWMASRLFNEQIYLMPLLLAPLISFILLLVFHKGTLGILHGTSLLNLLAFMLAVIISKRIFN